jgi:hypothetical protein
MSLKDTNPEAREVVVTATIVLDVQPDESVEDALRTYVAERDVVLAFAEVAPDEYADVDEAVARGDL